MMKLHFLPKLWVERRRISQFGIHDRRVFQYVTQTHSLVDSGFVNEVQSIFKKGDGKFLVISFPIRN